MIRELLVVRESSATPGASDGKLVPTVEMFSVFC